ncbi:MAG: hypothetical protein WCJ33_01600 [Pseudomonadota bacterium]
MSYNDTSKEEYQRLASQFVDIWQKNMAALMNDSDFIKFFLQMMQNPAFCNKENFFNDNNPKSSTGSAASSEFRDSAIASLKDSIESINKRIAIIEHSIAGLIASSAIRNVSGMERVAKKPKSSKSSRDRIPKSPKRVGKRNNKI